MTRVEFEAPVGLRILRSRFSGITTYTLNPEAPYLWWDFDNKRWVDRAVPGSSSHAPCRSYKAFLRHIKKHHEMLKGYEVVLFSRYVGYNISAFPEGETK